MPRQLTVTLGHIGFDSTRPDDWNPIMRDVLGLPDPAVAPDGSNRYKLDQYEHRIAVHPAERDGLRYISWEVPDVPALSAIVSKLNTEGIPWSDLPASEKATFGISDGVSAIDPAGLPLRLSVGARQQRTSQFVSPLGYRYVTGELGLGHIACMTGDYEATMDFYTSVLEMQVTDYLAGDLNVSFLGASPRHHSVAFVDTHHGQSGLDHIMLELDNLADLGRAYDRCIDGVAPLTYTLGSHWNDETTSFYFTTPSGCDIELGWAARLIDRTTHVSYQGDGQISSWGHRPLSEEAARRFGRKTWLTSLTNAHGAGLH